MDNILDIIPDNKGGQLKFRVDTFPCYSNYNDDGTYELAQDGNIVEVFEQDNKPFIGIAKTMSLTMYNPFILDYGRPKGYGVVLWIKPEMQINNIIGLTTVVMWTPFLGDEGYFE